MHLIDGEIRAYLDGELDPARQVQAAAHLASCAICRQQAETQRARLEWVQARFSTLAPQQVPRPLRMARARLGVRISQYEHEKETETMWRKSLKRIPRFAWVAITVLALLVVSMAFPSVRAAATSFLGLFRVQQVQVVPVDPGNLPEQLGSSSQFENMLSKDVKFDSNGEYQAAASPAEAGQLAGLAVRLPAALGDYQELGVEPGGKITLLVDLKMVRALLEEVGRGDIQLPDELDGATVTIEIPANVTARYGDCKFDLEKYRSEGGDPDEQVVSQMPKCTVFMQMASPTINAPAGLNVAQIGEAFLQVMGMSPEEAAQYAKNVDWTTTFVVPVPRYAASYQDVEVDGVKGTLVTQHPNTEGEQPQMYYLLMWVKDNVLYTLTGPGAGDAALDLANSIK